LLKEVFIDDNSNIIYEEVKNPGVIGKFKALLGRNNYVSKNGYRYCENFWNNVINTDSFKDKLNRKILFGGIDHPVGENDLPTLESVFVLSKVWMKGDELWGEFDILDCDAGRFLLTLFKYGVKFGVSLRARYMGDNVNELSYDPAVFDVLGWDIVKNPSVENAWVVNENRREFIDDLKLLKRSNNYNLRSIVNKIIESNNAYRIKEVNESIKNEYNNLLKKYSELEENYKKKIDEYNKLVEDYVNLKNKFNSVMEEYESKVSEYKDKLEILEKELVNKDLIIKEFENKRVDNTKTVVNEDLDNLKIVINDKFYSNNVNEDLDLKNRIKRIVF
jgi:hypothetical protein